ncbi:MAG: PilZ domain-containing protein [Phycisphaeraceae bacterium]|nr:PilZ domain-containing protein [Phycisphaeraceae bacterium]
MLTLTRPTEVAIQPASAADRRRDRRFGLARPSKVFRRATQTFIPALTRNISRSGALVELASARPMRLGEIVDIAVAYRRDALLMKETLVQAIVVRVDAIDDARQAVALRYLDADERANVAQASAPRPLAA